MRGVAGIRRRLGGKTLDAFWVALIFVAVWESLVRSGLVTPLFVSPPTLVVKTGYQLFVTGKIYPHLAASGEEFVLGFGAALLLGIPLGIIMGGTRTGRALEPLLMGLYATPVVALLPLLIIWLGIGLASKVAVVFLGSVFPIVINTMQGIRDTNPSLVEMGRSVCASALQIFLKIRLPYAMVMVLAGVRIAVGRALIMVVVAELYAANRGIGFLIHQAGGVYETAQIFLGAVILAMSGIILTAVVGRIEARLLRYRGD